MLEIAVSILLLMICLILLLGVLAFVWFAYRMLKEIKHPDIGRKR
jgi:hypothetical protein